MPETLSFHKDDAMNPLKIENRENESSEAETFSSADHMRILRTLLGRPGPKDYRIEESIKYLDRMILENRT